MNLSNILWQNLYPIITQTVYRLIDWLPPSNQAAQWKDTRLAEPPLPSTHQTSNHPHLPLKTQSYLYLCPSLGEYEAIRSIIAHQIAKNPNDAHEISFFSSSGYIPLTNSLSHRAEHISYMPADTKKEVSIFFNSRNVKEVYFSTLVIWPVLLDYLIDHRIPYHFIGITFKNGIIKKLYYRTISRYINHARTIFVIDQMDKDHYNNIWKDVSIIVAGDPRLSSIKEQQSNPPIEINKIIAFKTEQPIIIFGSTHQADEKILLPSIENLLSHNWKIIIAPHEPPRAKSIKEKIDGSILFSQFTSDSASSVMIIDSIGLLKHCYSYSDITYIGGGFKTGLHSIMEPLMAQNVVITGPDTSQSRHAQKLASEGTIIIIRDLEEFIKAVKTNSSVRRRTEIFVKSDAYVRTQLGAADIIIKALDKGGQ